MKHTTKYLCMLSALGVILSAPMSVLIAQAPAPQTPNNQPPPPPPTAGAHLAITDGSSASYRVSEQLVGISFPNDAIGSAPVASGNITINPDGTIASGSKLTVDLRLLQSDQSFRDNYLRQRTLETDKFPFAEFVPTRIEGLPKLIPSAGQAGIHLTGNLTVHGVTKEVTFVGITTFNPRDSTVAGRVKTEFNFATFGLTKPSLARIVTIDDKIELEIAFRFKRS